MISLRQINALPAPERDRCYLSIVPPSFWKRFGLDPLAFTALQGRQLASVEAPPEEVSVRISIKHRADALVYERQGFGYLAGQDRMEAIHRGFQPGEVLAGRLDGSTPFRASGAWASIRGRSWAIHDGILPQRWWPPVMYRPIGVRLGICTAPGVPF